ncbi:MAG: hypothetical protein HOK63_05525 [Thaumarchaeota archaeon]|jgi:hypothetical protein|nr:hypothetical protein [Nitrososphaerota archaeon]MBT5842938.1 hypothetical protein [Nitrososphaerota archaeon]MBT6469091.1 hypothetical protein [Nitrososphaerota archaeon]
MKVSTVFGIIGAIILILGIIFHLQGLSIVGPESSFMYSNPEWISYGIQILIIGIIVIGISIGIKVLKNY